MPPDMDKQAPPKAQAGRPVLDLPT